MSAHRLSPGTELADALERADWSGVSIGNKVMLKGAIDALRRVAQSAPSDPEETGNFWCRACNGTGRAPPSAALVSSTEQRYPHGHPYKADAPFDPAAQEIMGVAVTSKTQAPK